MAALTFLDLPTVRRKKQALRSYGEHQVSSLHRMNGMEKGSVALSLRQPWAALVAAGRKTIEIRSWSTDRRGTILIHASKQVDERPDVWAGLDAERELLRLAELKGGIIGRVELVECRPYCTRAAFARDRARHLNHPAWFQPPRLYGFVFRNARVLPFRRFRGWVKFFAVPARP